MGSLRFLCVATAAVLAGTACGLGDDGGPDGAAAFEQPYTGVEAYPVFVNSELVVGENRFLVGILNDRDAPISSPDLDVTVAFYDLEESTEAPVASTDMEFVWAIPDVHGVYVTSATFARAGKWGAEVSIVGDGIEETVKGSFEVAEEGTTPAIGEKVPASDTPTAADVADLSEITTDADPAARFYRYSIASALRREEPFVVTFATPEFCTSAVCGPTLDTVKDVAAGFRGINFVHVEVYELPADPSNLEVVPAVEEWGLRSEPWVFVVSPDGSVVAKYEGVVGADELRAELERL